MATTDEETRAARDARLERPASAAGGRGLATKKRRRLSPETTFALIEEVFAAGALCRCHCLMGVRHRTPCPATSDPKVSQSRLLDRPRCLIPPDA
jgi:hypothetical protein